MLEKVKTLFYFYFLVIHHNWLMKFFFIETRCILGKCTKGA